MIRNILFPTKRVVFAQIVAVPSDHYGFAENGDPRKTIFCHIMQGGPLEVSRHGEIVIKRLPEPDVLPHVGEEIVLVRESENPNDRGYTKALFWASKSKWDEVSWATNAKRVYRAYAYNHRVNGQFLTKTNDEDVLVEAKLIDIVWSNPRTGSINDTLNSKHESSIKGKGNKKATVYSYDVRWMSRADDGVWVHCADPRPLHVTVS